ncbi:hypothetical protein [Teredinibacter haidensis]|nr:hypothetical protein [Teredinibacter haidensis]
MKKKYQDLTLSVAGFSSEPNDAYLYQSKRKDAEWMDAQASRL